MEPAADTHSNVVQERDSHHAIHDLSDGFGCAALLSFAPSALAVDGAVLTNPEHDARYEA
jgi:hypothetical protein